ncbi:MULTISPECIES: DNA repair protein RecN [unclassified Thermosynechococcus]|uniref:DNA repair protein RecN n=1 Tax=unclassified Thermosynechococcus TaxID=2622553 RepID=UPI002872C1C6|nr:MULTISPECIES: DNA repair protein RecN [unclassified Thermosynechococcus]WNC31297.1 DNA repair protein RecN [Thermosynechococcus sp. PKX95]WNC33821.1 DNA repair protein RecN [Thermosynechococcus sp. PKX91]WNC36345.1 DNA repair protein RecN [Thermosynechococcus sp. WL11]WNC38866.1 DNA repair protein RecN [Thermosynechococcus sp. WL17]WNC41388.1 DNA repair protein RecN [Thermosynechococcus sp. WL15]
MLQTLRIQNFALVAELEVTFQRGLNVLTGETGAGKSILLDAIDALLGGKLSARQLRSGTEQGCIEAIFTLTPPVRDWLATLEIDAEGDEVICSREFSLKGETFRSRSRVNGVLVNRQQLQELRRHLVRLTAQGQAVQLASASQQRDWLDRYGGEALMSQRQRVADAYRVWQQRQRELQNFAAQEQQRLQRLDLLHFQLQELLPAALDDPEELTQLQQDYQRLSHVQELQSQSQQAYHLLYEGEPSVVTLLAQAQGALQSIADWDPALQPMSELLEGAIAHTEEAARQLRSYADRLDADPATLDALGQRIHQLQRLCRKYGPDLASVIAYRDRIQAELAALSQQSISQERLAAEVAQLRQALEQASAELHELRLRAAERLEQDLLTHLCPLGLPQARFTVQLTTTEASSSGSDEITFLWSANPGQPLQPLGEVASGGEMSRFLLALETCLTTQQTPKTLIFDEIDVGVSGRVAGAIAESLSRLGQTHQVLCVTHQSLIAAAADHHYLVQKDIDPSTATTVIRVQYLTSEARVQALADLAGGDRSAMALSFASGLLAQQQRPFPPNAKGISMKT